MAELRDGNGATGTQTWDAVGSLFGAGGPLNADSAASGQSQADSLLASAKSGGFKITEQGVQPLLKAISDMRDQMPQLDQVGYVVGQAPQLGSHQYGGTVASHVQKGGAGGPGAAADVVSQFDQTLRTIAEALERASGLYKESDASAQDAFRGTSS